MHLTRVPVHDIASTAVMSGSAVHVISSHPISGAK